MIETPQRKPSVLRIGGRYLLSTSTTVGSLTVAENAELVMGENLELQTRGILVKGLGFFLFDVCQFTYPMLAGTGTHMIQFVLVWALWAYVTIFTFYDHLDKLSTLWKITIFHNISQFFTISWKQTSPKFHQNFHHILGTEFQQFANTLGSWVGWFSQPGLLRAGSATCRVKGLVITFTGNGDKDARPWSWRQMFSPIFFIGKCWISSKIKGSIFPAKTVHVK